MTKYRFTSAALTELRQAILYYEQRENGLGSAFLDEIEATLNRILRHPTRLAPHVFTNKTLSNASLSVWPDLPDPY
jgi:hypothetical protein